MYVHFKPKTYKLQRIIFKALKTTIKESATWVIQLIPIIQNLNFDAGLYPVIKMNASRLW